MGQSNEEIIYSIRLNIEQTNQALKDFAATAGMAKKASDDLRASVGDQVDTSTRQAEAAKKTKEAVEAEEGSIRALREENKRLTAERNNASTATEAGRARIQELNKHLDENNTKIKANVDAYTKQKIGIGDYSGALDKLIPGLGATVNGIEGMTKSALAFIATPIGLVIAAVAAAVALLAQYFTRTEAGGDLLAKRMDQLSAIFNVLLDRAAMLGGALVKLFSGDFIGAANDAAKAVSGVTDEIEREVKAAGELADMLDELEDRELAYGVAVSETTNQIKLLIIQSKNRTLSEQERIDLLTKATNLEIVQNEILKQIRLDELTATTKQIEMDFNQLGVKKQLGQSEMDFAKSIVNNADITIAARTKVADAIKAYNAAEGDSLELRAKIADKIDALAEKAAQNKVALELWTTAELKKLADAKMTDDDKAYVLGNQKLQVAINSKVSWNEKANAAIAASQKKLADQIVAGDNKMADVRVANQFRALDATDQTLKASLGLFKKGTMAYKVLATAETIMNTTKAAMGAFSSAASIPIVGWILGPIAAGIAIAYGAKQLAEINGVHFAGGGRADRSRGPISGTRITSKMGTPVRMRNGDDLLATVKANEVILNEQQQRALGGNDTFRRIGVPGFALGGFTGDQLGTRVAFSNEQARGLGSSMNFGDHLDRINDSIQNIQRPILVLQDFDAAQSKQQQPANAAIVL